MSVSDDGKKGITLEIEVEGEPPRKIRERCFEFEIWGKDADAYRDFMSGEG